MTEPVIYPPDPRCWFCPDGKAVQQRPPLCRSCRLEALERLRRFLAGSRAVGRLRGAGQAVRRPAPVVP